MFCCLIEEINYLLAFINLHMKKKTFFSFILLLAVFCDFIKTTLVCRALILPVSNLPERSFLMFPPVYNVLFRKRSIASNVLTIIFFYKYNSIFFKQHTQRNVLTTYVSFLFVIVVFVHVFSQAKVAYFDYIMVCQ